ncbi:MAG: DNA polymerase IV, partial [Bacillota bacterium]|nr:DNA polymerase IV [Bacillota bacterium]
MDHPTSLEPLSYAVFHVDVNSAYLAWEAIDRLQHGDPVDLRLLTAVVGGDEASRHGIVLAKSAKAKKAGIITGESLYAARQRVPNLVVVPPRYHLYMECSRAMIDVLREYSPVVQQYSI